MVSDLLDDGVIKVARVAQEIRANLVCVFETLEDIGGDGILRPLSKLSPLGLALGVDVLHPAVMLRRSLVRDVLLEDHDVGVGDCYSIGRGDEWCRVTVDGLCVEGWCR